MPEPNVPRSELPSTAWAAADAATALARAYDLADAHAGRAADWYTKKMKWRGRQARFIRLVALVVFGIGGIIPIAKAFLPRIGRAAAAAAGEAASGAASAGAYVEWNDVGYVALAAGAALLGFDHFFGISSAYTRFVTTEIALRNARLRFQTDWLVLLTQSAGFKAGELKPFVDRLTEFVALVLQLVDRETQEWVAEFRSSLAELEKLGDRTPRAAAKQERPREGEPSGPPKNGGTEKPGSQPPAPAVVAPAGAAPVVPSKDG